MFRDKAFNKLPHFFGLIHFYSNSLCTQTNPNKSTKLKEIYLIISFLSKKITRTLNFTELHFSFTKKKTDNGTCLHWN